ncbi:hypothetical protein AB3N02_21865 [Priestia aryabhattai]
MGKVTRKCQICGIDDTHMDDMKFEVVGIKRPQKKYYHELCYEEHLKQQAFKDKEAKELDELRLVIQEIYGIDPLPNPAYPFLQKIRNGEPALAGKKKYDKRYKEGYSYPLIKETFEYCSDSIERANATKNFDGFMGAFRYGLAIIIDKLYFVEQRARKREQQKRQIEKHVEELAGTEQTFETSYKKPKKSKVDISAFLD